MKTLIKPERLKYGDKIAVVSPCNGWAGAPEILWKYNLGVSRLRELGLEVIAAPNTLKGSEYLSKNPGVCTEDIMWALESNLCPVPDALKTALKVRKSPLEFKKDKSTLDYAQMLGDPIQKFADILKKEAVLYADIDRDKYT